MHIPRIVPWLLGLCGAPLLAQRVDITIPAMADATLYEDLTGSTSNGGGTGIFIGNTAGGLRRRALVQFDIAAAVPAGARIVFVQLGLTVAQTPLPTPIDVDLFRVLQPWGEGRTVAAGNGGSGGVALPGDATWIHTFQPQLWNTPGGHFAAASSGRFAMPAAGAFTLGTTSQMIADVQDWLDGGAPNAGWLLKTDEVAASTAHRLFSREETQAGVRPSLAIGYVPAGNALAVGTGCQGSNGLPFLQSVTGTLLQGSQATLGMHQGLSGGIAATLMSYGIRAQPITVYNGCTLFLELLPWPSFGIRVLDAAGDVADTYTIPRSPGLFGAPVALQSFELDPGLGTGFVFSNAHLIVLR